ILKTSPKDSYRHRILKLIVERLLEGFRQEEILTRNQNPVIDEQVPTRSSPSPSGSKVLPAPPPKATQPRKEPGIYVNGQKVSEVEAKRIKTDFAYFQSLKGDIEDIPVPKRKFF